LSSAIDHIDCRFSALQKPPLSDFAVLNYSKWPYEKTKLAAFGNEEIGHLVQHFSSSNRERGGCDTYAVDELQESSVTAKDF